MEIDDLFAWDFDNDLTEGCEIQCPQCEVWISHYEWLESEVGCEDCGSHPTMLCPECDAWFDHVWGPEFKVRTLLDKAYSKGV